MKQIKKVSPQHCFTVKANGLLRQLLTDVKISIPNPSAPYSASTIGYTCKAIWDTGATSSSITNSVVTGLGLKATGGTNLITAGGMFYKNTYIVNIELPNKLVITDVTVTECDNLSQNPSDNIHVLIGMDIFSLGDFSLTNHNGKSWFSFRFPSMHQVDYVDQFNTQLYKGVGRNDRCPCDSGEKFKNCHGKPVNS